MLTHRQHFFDRPAPPTPGNLYQPSPDWTSAEGGWHGRRKTTVRRGLTALAVGAALTAPAIRRRAA